MSYQDHFYTVYGLTIRADFSLGYLPRAEACKPDVSFHAAPADWFQNFRNENGLVLSAAAADWYQQFPCADGRHYVAWRDLFEFVVSTDGSAVFCGRSSCASDESFETYLLGQALSYALVKQGYEPLHATAIVVHGHAIALLGNSGDGKSTLAAGFLRAGHQLLTDDLLLMREVAGANLAYPGPPRIKLLPRPAACLLPEHSDGVPMNSETDKLIMRLSAPELCTEPVPLAAIVTLRRQTESCQILLEPILGARGALELLRCTFNSRLRDQERLHRQFVETRRIVRSIPVKQLTYPAGFEHLDSVCRFIESEVESRLQVGSAS